MGGEWCVDVETPMAVPMDVVQDIFRRLNYQKPAKLFVLGVPLVLSLLALAVSDYVSTFQPLADRGCLLIVAVYAIVIGFEQKINVVPYAFGSAIFIESWVHYQPTVFAMDNAATWINIMFCVHLFAMG